MKDKFMAEIFRPRDVVRLYIINNGADVLVL